MKKKKVKRHKKTRDIIDKKPKDFIKEDFKSLRTFQHPIFRHPRTLGQKVADGVTKWAGSWTFIILFFVFLGFWMATNGIFVLKYINKEIVDPYPFILLNLALSCLAAIQAPLILMSQNRENQRDRIRAKFDYAINKKAEKEIRAVQSQLNRIERKLLRKR